MGESGYWVYVRESHKLPIDPIFSKSVFLKKANK